MRTARSLMGVGRLGFVLGSLAACSNGVQSLGEDAPLGSAGTRASTGNGTGTLATGGTATGGNSTTPLVPITSSAVGGNAPRTQTTSFGGEEPALPAGGGAGYGGSTGIAHAGSGGSVDPICNESNQCVPRCDASGRCALWQTNRRAVVDLLVDGTALYFLTAATTSASGVMGSPGSLYRAELGSPVPTQLTSLYEIPVAILGRFAGATYLHASDQDGAQLVRIDDIGSMGSIGHYGPPAMQGSRVIAAASDGMSLIQFDLNADPYFRQSAPLPTQDSSSPGAPVRHVLQPYVFDELVGFTSDNPDSWCWIISAAPSAASCVGRAETMPGRILANSANQVFVASSTAPNSTLTLTAYDATGQQPRVLYTGATHEEYVVQASYAPGWLYALLGVGESQARVVRFSTSVPRPPQEVIPSEIVTPAFLSSGASTQFDFAVGPSGIYWTAAQVDITQSQYIYHAPLPPQPCDSELPCADPKQVCTNGFCLQP